MFSELRSDIGTWFFLGYVKILDFF